MDATAHQEAKADDEKVKGPELNVRFGSGPQLSFAIRPLVDRRPTLAGWPVCHPPVCAVAL